MVCPISYGDHKKLQHSHVKVILNWCRKGQNQKFIIINIIVVVIIFTTCIYSKGTAIDTYTTHLNHSQQTINGHQALTNAFEK